ncbi:MAG: ComF family protein [Saprospiraceae bacterium]
MHMSRENAFSERFWGRIPIETGTAMYFFNRKSPIQKALHRLKYQNQPDIGVRIGWLMGNLLRQSPMYQQLDGIVPVPLHPQKEHLRGYNQSEKLAEGLTEALNAPVLKGVLVRTSISDSQTRKKRMARFENVNEMFAVRHPDRVKNSHLLLVDDVLTTGATLEACGKQLLDVPNVRLSMATIAIAVH